MLDILTIFAWWYGMAPKRLGNFCIATVKFSYHLFSLPYLAKTIFAPWKKDIVIPINPTFGDNIKAFSENLISRLFGFIIRAGTIIIGIIVLIITIILLVIFMILWFLLPAIILAGLYYAVSLLIK